MNRNNAAAMMLAMALAGQTRVMPTAPKGKRRKPYTSGIEQRITQAMKRRGMKQ